MTGRSSPDAAAGESAAESFERRVALLHGFVLGAILVASLGIRLYHVTSPPTSHLAWRETQTLMIARNFWRDGMNLFLPAVDWRSTTGNVADGTIGGTELNVIPFLTAILYQVFGTGAWVGRVAPIFFSVLGLYWFHRLAARFYGQAAAHAATTILAVSPYYLYCGRTQLPEPFAFSMAFGGLLYFDRWLESQRRGNYALAIACCLFAILGKPQIAVIAFPMAWLLFHRMGFRFLKRADVWAFAAAVAVPNAAYIAYSYGVLLPRTGLSFAQPGLINFDVLSYASFYRKIGASVWNVVLTPPVAVLALLGLLRPSSGMRGWMPHAWAIGSVSLFALMPGGTNANEYYLLALAPPAAMASGAVFGLAFRRWYGAIPALAVLAFAVYTSLAAVAPFYSFAEPYAYPAGKWLAENTPGDALVLTAAPNPATLYYADRKGWITWLENYGTPIEFNADLIDRVGGLGASFIVVPDARFDMGFFDRFRSMKDILYHTYRSHRELEFGVFNLGRRADLHLPDGGTLLFNSMESRKYLRGNWGPFGKSGDVSFVPMQPALEGALHFRTRAPIRDVQLVLAGAVDGETLSVEINGKPMDGAKLERAWITQPVLLTGVPPPDKSGLYRVTLKADKANSAGVSLALYAVMVR